MKYIFQYIKGDRYLWAFILLLALFSFLPVYSSGNDYIKHLLFLIIGFLIIYFISTFDYKYTSGIAVIALPIVVILLIVTLYQGNSIDGSNAARWLKIPILGIGFQTSTLASMVLLIYISRYLVGIKDKKITFKESILPLWAPIFIIILLILPANGSTALLIFSMCIMVLFIGGYPPKFLFSLILAGVIAVSIFIALAFSFPDKMPSRVQTWKSRIEKFTDPNQEIEDDYQVYIAKSAISNSGFLWGRGPGQSHFKDALPMANSDFIFALIIEEYSSLGGLLLLTIYVLILWRINVIATRIHTYYGSLMVYAIGLPIMFQAFANTAVAVNLIPVTGQTLPMISAGGTSIWVTCIAFGLILSVSRATETKEEYERKKLNENEPIA